ncbi:MAG: MobA/MobL family protein [Bacillota bacterium]
MRHPPPPSPSPAGSPAWAQDRAQLWNAVEKAERRADAQVAREIVVAFPKELSKEQQRDLIAGYVREQFVAQGMVADVAIHSNPRGRSGAPEDRRGERDWVGHHPRQCPPGAACEVGEESRASA